MTVETTQALSLTKSIAATPEAVFEALTSAEHMSRWCCPDPTADVDIEVDLRVGGAFQIKMDVEGGPYTAHGVYREIDPPRRLVYTWDWREADHRMDVETVVTIELSEVDGGTLMQLTHEGFPSVEAKAAHEEGWTPCLEHLARVVG